MAEAASRSELPAPAPSDHRPSEADLTFLSFAIGPRQDKSLPARKDLGPPQGRPLSSIDEFLRGYRLMALLVRLWVDVSHQL
jgi:hypothetical protein